MRRRLLALGVALPLLLGCGDEEESENDPTGPRGELSERAIGAAQQGMSTAEVEEAFGRPDREQEQPGCELAGPNATPILQWTWDLEDGSASIDFDAAGEELITYRTTSQDLPTTNGVRVGDSYETLSQSYGPTLRPLDLGLPSNERSGLWYVGKPARSWLLFTIAGGKVTTIQGGDIQICE